MKILPHYKCYKTWFDLERESHNDGGIINARLIEILGRPPNGMIWQDVYRYEDHWWYGDRPGEKIDERVVFK